MSPARLLGTFSLGHPAEQQGRMQMVLLQGQQRLVSAFSSGFYSVPQAGQRDVVAPCLWLEFPQKKVDFS